MIKSGTNIIIMLILVLVMAGCTPGETAEQTATASTPVIEPEQEAVESGPAGGSEGATAVSTPVDTPEEPIPTKTVTAEPQLTATVKQPVDKDEPLSDDKVGQFYAAAIRRMYSSDHSFGGPGETPEYPLVYIVSTTDDGTLLFHPATQPEELSLEVR